eukprot:CAMPEP_0171198632 /NCGR_PEP_ID=MMETSP0790-20130122/23044_1 /TAXON_ID=2925 /ORGANISM="Alexandrium catenella, Strain OF101" /LENGTH=59 /DNA_ID=CAMNT_0011663945 /DNA_START=23 /DNA_END=199 /DNA_ORIENTATION=+
MSSTLQARPPQLWKLRQGVRVRHGRQRPSHLGHELPAAALLLEVHLARAGGGHLPDRVA